MDRVRRCLGFTACLLAKDGEMALKVLGMVPAETRQRCLTRTHTTLLNLPYDRKFPLKNKLENLLGIILELLNKLIES